MTRLADVIEALQLEAGIELDGRWARLDGERCRIYVVEAAGGTGYYTWCDEPGARTVEFYRDPIAAIEAGMRRAARHAPPDTLGQ